MKRPVTINSVLTGTSKAFTIIPECILNYEGEDTGKRLAAYIYFDFWRNYNNEVLFSVEHLVTWCGMKPDKAKGRTNTKYINVILDLIHKGYISCPEFENHFNGNAELTQPYRQFMTAKVNPIAIERNKL